MDAKLQDSVCHIVEKEIEAIVNKDEMTPTELEQLGELIDIIKDIKEIEGEEKGYSGRVSYATMPYWGQISYEDQYRGRAGDNRISYGRDNRPQYNRGNDGGSSYGRYYEDGRMMPDRGWN